LVIGETALAAGANYAVISAVPYQLIPLESLTRLPVFLPSTEGFSTGMGNQPKCPYYGYGYHGERLINNPEIQVYGEFELPSSLALLSSNYLLARSYGEDNFFFVSSNCAVNANPITIWKRAFALSLLEQWRQRLSPEWQSRADIDKDLYSAAANTANPLFIPDESHVLSIGMHWGGVLDHYRRYSREGTNIQEINRYENIDFTDAQVLDALAEILAQPMEKRTGNTYDGHFSLLGLPTAKISMDTFLMLAAIDTFDSSFSTPVMFVQDETMVSRYSVPSEPPRKTLQEFQQTLIDQFPDYAHLDYSKFFGDIDYYRSIEPEVVLGNVTEQAAQGLFRVLCNAHSPAFHSLALYPSSSTSFAIRSLSNIANLYEHRRPLPQPVTFCHAYSKDEYFNSFSTATGLEFNVGAHCFKADGKCTAGVADRRVNELVGVFDKANGRFPRNVEVRVIAAGDQQWHHVLTVDRPAPYSRELVAQMQLRTPYGRVQATLQMGAGNSVGNIQVFSPTQ